MAAVYRLYREQRLPASVTALWHFLCDPANLDEITPPQLGFEILGDPPPQMHDGMMIEYRVRIPWLGRRTWLSEIKHIEEGVRFVDEQRIGPYKLWYHRHELQSVADGTLVIDDIHYAVPGGPLAPLVHALLVRPQLERIFAFRQRRLQELFDLPRP